MIILGGCVSQKSLLDTDCGISLVTAGESIESTTQTSSIILIGEPEEIVSDTQISDNYNDSHSDTCTDTECVSCSWFNPYGVWEITDSTQALEHFAPYEKEPWPLEPLSNGKRIIIADGVFSVDEYDNFDSSEFSFICFKTVKIVSITWDYLASFRLLNSAIGWITDMLPYETFSVNFFIEEAPPPYYYFPNMQIFVVDNNTILYSDSWYFYKLCRVEDN